ncbi:MAG: hypothetical protein VX741_11800, partial [Pseudomonadota bacterium]|nr:hypothetical protein [Pseudomonadota bacterium]
AGGLSNREPIRLTTANELFVAVGVRPNARQPEQKKYRRKQIEMRGLLRLKTEGEFVLYP